MHRNRKYAPEPKRQGHPESMRQRAVEMYVNSGNLRRIARHLKVSPQKIAYWVSDVAEAVPNAPLLNEVKETEIDEMFTFIGDKKMNSILSLWQITKLAAFWAGGWSGFARRQLCSKLSISPKANWFYSDGFESYPWLWYHFGRYEISVGKSDTYSVEADNA